MLSAKPKDLSLIPSMQIVGENQFLQVVLWHPHTCTVAWEYAHTNTLNKCKKLKRTLKQYNFINSVLFVIVIHFTSSWAKTPTVYYLLTIGCIKYTYL